MVEQGKIINSLRQRRSIESAIREMLEATSSQEFEAQARRIARQGDQVISVITANLETSDPRFRGALGSVARHLDRDDISFALREVVMQPSRSDQARTTALMILERFLDEEIGDDLYLELSDPLEVARQSLEEAITEARKDRQTFVDYLQSLEGESVEVSILVLRATETMEPCQIEEPLRLLAQDPRRAVSREAIRILGTLRTPGAVEALRTILTCLPAERRTWAERSLRKLSFAGVKAPDPLPLGERCRLMVSPVDGQGNRSVWVLEHSGEPGPVNLVTIMLEAERGIVECFGAEGLTETPLNWSPQVGAVHRLSLPRRGFALDLLEADPGYAVRLIIGGIIAALERNECLPLAFRVWGRTLLHNELPKPLPQQLPDVHEEMEPRLLRRSVQLLGHPAFDEWAPMPDWIYGLVADWEGPGPPDRSTAAGADLIDGLVARHWRKDELFATRIMLLDNSEWFLGAGEDSLAELAFAAGHALDWVEPKDHPFLACLAERSLARAWDSLRRGQGPEA